MGLNESVHTDTWFLLFKSMGMLCIVLATLFLVFFLVKKMAKGHGDFINKTVIKALASYYVAPKNKVVLLDVLGEKILIGVTPQNINYIAKIDKNNEVDIPETSPKNFFKDLINNAVADKKNT